MSIEAGVESPRAVIQPVPSLRLDNSGVPNGREYNGGCRLFRAVAEGIGVDLAPQDIEDWKVLLGAAFIIDALIDDREQDIRPLIDRAIEGESVPGVSDDAIEACRSYLDRQPHDRREAIVAGLHEIGGFAEQYREVDDAKQLVDLRLKEADIYADFLKLGIGEHADSEARGRFNNWIERFSRCGYLFDSLVDLRQDYSDGCVGTAPTLKAHVTLAKEATREFIPGVRETPFWAIGRTARVACEYLLGARYSPKA